MTSDEQRIQNVLTLTHNGPKSASQQTYRLYVGLLVTVLGGIPLVSGIVRLLLMPDVLPTILSAESLKYAGLASVALLSFAVLLGRIRGPALLPPFPSSVLLATEMPRSKILGRSFWSSNVKVFAGISGGAALLGGTAVYSGDLTVVEGIAFQLTGSAYGLLLGFSWLLGQGLNGAAGVRKIFLVLALVCTACASLILALAGSVAGLTLICVIATTATLLVPKVLNDLDGTYVFAQASLAARASSAAFGGDFTTVSSLYRAVPTTGRRLRTIHNLPVGFRYLAGDTVAALRTPARVVSGILGLAAGSFLILFSLVPGGPIPVVFQVVGAALSFAGLGIFSDGFRLSAEAAAAPALYRFSTPHLYALHAASPMVLSALCTALVSVPLVMSYGIPVRSVLGAMGISWFFIVVRIFDTAKGPLPPVLLSPVYTPGGDLSGIAVVLWQIDALLIASVFCAFTLSLNGLWAAVAFSGFAVAAVLFGTQRRLSR